MSKPSARFLKRAILRNFIASILLALMLFGGASVWKAFNPSNSGLLDANAIALVGFPSTTSALFKPHAPYHPGHAGHPGHPGHHPGHLGRLDTPRLTSNREAASIYAMDLTAGLATVIVVGLVLTVFVRRRMSRSA